MLEFFRQRLPFLQHEALSPTDSIYRQFLQVAEHTGKLTDIQRSPHFPTDKWETDVKTVIEESYKHLGPLVSLFVIDSAKKNPQRQLICPIRSGQIFEKVAHQLGIANFSSFGFPAIIRDLLWEHPDITGLPATTQYWLQNSDLAQILTNYNNNVTLVDWGAEGKIPLALNGIRQYYFNQKYHKSMPPFLSIQASFLFSTNPHRFPYFIGELPRTDTIAKLDEEKSPTDPHFRGLLTLAEVTHDRLRGPLEPREHNNDFRGVERNPHPNPVIWALNTAAELSVLFWCKQNKKQLQSGKFNAESTTDTINRAITWTADFNEVDFDLFTLRGWKSEINRLSI